ncbi:hypothetical protein HDV00_001986 [Rhizophlyctis rosea]|nr:hypothetical protein HDV00_001986 [Rhizophlyctis rosea]
MKLLNMERALRAFPTRDTVLFALKDLDLVFMYPDTHIKFAACEHQLFLLLRLDHDQRCYDMVKWFATLGQTYNWDQMPEESFLTIHGADVFEDVEYLKGEKRLSLLVAVILIKYRLLMDLKEMTRRRLMEDSGPTERREGRPRPSFAHLNITYHSSIFALATGSEHAADNLAHITLDRQISALFKLVNSANAHFWKTLLSPEGCTYQTPLNAPATGSLEEAQAVLPKCFDAWMETDGAMEWPREKVKGNGEHSERVLGGLGVRTRQRQGQGQGQHQQGAGMSLGMLGMLGQQGQQQGQVGTGTGSVQQQPSLGVPTTLPPMTFGSAAAGMGQGQGHQTRQESVVDILHRLQQLQQLQESISRDV